MLIVKYLPTTVLLACVLVQSGSAQQREPATVDSGGLGWFVKDARLHHGEMIDLGVELVGRKPNNDLILKCPTPPGAVSYSCRGETCRVKACELNAPGVTVHQLGMLARLSEWLGAGFEREPVEAVIAAARAGGNPTDAVVLLDARGVHWGPTLTRVLEGRSCFRLSALPARSPNQSRSFELDWDRAIDSEGIAPIAGMTPGLYAFEKGDSTVGGTCARDPDATPAWVLVAPGSDFERLTAEWKQRAASIGQLEASGAGLSVITAARHGALADLARAFPPR